jgi:predicted glycosyltransferase
MRILVDITHPAHVHFYRNPISLWREKGHEVLIAARDKDIALNLLDRYQLRCENLGRARSGIVGLGVELFTRNARLWQLTRRLRPDVMTGIGGVFIAQVGWLSRIPSVVFTDTENATFSNRLTFPFCTVVVTPRCYEAPVPGAKHLTYPGYHELAYTHPQRFRPEPEALTALGVDPADPFVVMRLVSWGAAHDLRDHGFTNVTEVVSRLQRHARVLISSEAPLPESVEPLRITAPPELIHQLLYHARLFIGESATMASESATLGTPALLVSTSTRGYTNEQEDRYGLTFTFSDPETAQREAGDRAIQLLGEVGTKEKWAGKRDRMLAEMVDVSQYVADVVQAHGQGKQFREAQTVT